MKTTLYILAILASVALLTTSCKKTTPAPVYKWTGGWYVFKSDTVYIKSSVYYDNPFGMQALTSTDSTIHHRIIFDFTYGVDRGVQRDLNIYLYSDTTEYLAYGNGNNTAYVDYPQLGAGKFGIQGWQIKFVNSHNYADSTRVDFIVNELGY